MGGPILQAIPVLAVIEHMRRRATDKTTLELPDVFREQSISVHNTYAYVHNVSAQVVSFGFFAYTHMRMQAHRDAHAHNADMCLSATFRDDTFFSKHTLTTRTLF